MSTGRTNKLMWKITILFAVSLAYAVLRYVAFAPKNAGNIPAFVTNKAISMAAALCLAIAFCQQWRRRRGRAADDPAAWFRAGVCGALAHIPLSLVLMRPGYFPEFFDGDRFNTGGEAVFLFGSLTTAGIYLLGRTGWTAVPRWWLSLAATATLFGHTLCMGLNRGMNINRSHGYLPPMWLISLLAAGLGIAFLLLTRPSSSGQEENPTARSRTGPSG